MPASISIKVGKNTVTRNLSRITKQIQDFDPVDLAIAIRDRARMNLVTTNIGWPQRRTPGNLFRSIRVPRHGKHQAVVQAGGPTTTVAGHDYAVIQEQGRGPITALEKPLRFKGLFGGFVVTNKVRRARGRHYWRDAIAVESTSYASDLGRRRMKAIIDSGGTDNGLRIGIVKQLG